MKKDQFITCWLKPQVRNLFNRAGIERLAFGKSNSVLNAHQLRKQGLTDSNFKKLREKGIIKAVKAIADKQSK